MEMSVQVHALSALPQGNSLGTYSVGDWTNIRGVLDTWERKIICCFTPGSEPQFSSYPARCCDNRCPDWYTITGLSTDLSPMFSVHLFLKHALSCSKVPNEGMGRCKKERTPVVLLCTGIATVRQISDCACQIQHTRKVWWLPIASRSCVLTTLSTPANKQSRVRRSLAKLDDSTFRSIQEYDRDGTHVRVQVRAEF